MVPLDLDADEDGQPQADLVRRQPGLVSLDDPGFLQQAHAAQAGRRGQPDLFGQLDIRQPAVLLQSLEDAAIIAVQYAFWHELWIV
ncbi:hypothetical protein D9M69_705870 [compost metagenome]